MPRSRWYCRLDDVPLAGVTTCLVAKLRKGKASTVLAVPSPNGFFRPLPGLPAGFLALFGLILGVTSSIADEAPPEASLPWWEELDSLPSPETEIHRVIDAQVDAKLLDRSVTPAPRAPLEVRTRRAMLDLAGRIPTVAELDAIQALPGEAPDRGESYWETLVSELVESPAFDRLQSHELNWLLMEGKQSDYRGYLEEAVAQRRPWNEIFRETVLAQREGEESPGVDAFLRDLVKDPDKLTNEVSVRFFGVNISCAQCHDHPYVKDWTQETYYGMQAFFSRSFENGGFIGEREYGQVSYKTTQGEERVAPPRFLGGAALDEPDAPEPDEAAKKAERDLLNQLKKDKKAPPAPGYSRRARLAEVGLSEAQEEWLARSIVNRVWYRFFGHGLVMPLDQMHGENDPSHPVLLQWLARDLIAHDYDLRRLMEGIVLSQAYQRDSQWESGFRPAASLFAVTQPRPLTPRQYGVTLKFATTAPETFTVEAAQAPEEKAKRLENLERGGSGLANWFERPGENFSVAVDEALLLSNSDSVRGQLLASSGLVGSLEKLESSEAKVRLALRSVYSRDPKPGEVETLTGYLDARQERPREAIEQLVWALLTSAEARFNH